MWAWRPGATIARKLTISRIPSAGRLTVICHGGGCPFAKRTITPRHGQVALALPACTVGDPRAPDHGRQQSRRGRDLHDQERSAAVAEEALHAAGRTPPQPLRIEHHPLAERQASGATPRTMVTSSDASESDPRSSRSRSAIDRVPAIAPGSRWRYGSSDRASRACCTRGS
jgi:hypothetical protein